MPRSRLAPASHVLGQNPCDPSPWLLGSDRPRGRPWHSIPASSLPGLPTGCGAVTPRVASFRSTKGPQSLPARKSVACGCLSGYAGPGRRPGAVWCFTPGATRPPITALTTRVGRPQKGGLLDGCMCPPGMYYRRCRANAAAVRTGPPG